MNPLVIMPLGWIQSFWIYPSVGLPLTLLVLLVLLLLPLPLPCLLLYFSKMAMRWWVYTGVSRTDTSTIDHGQILEDTHHSSIEVQAFGHFDPNSHNLLWSSGRDSAFRADRRSLGWIAFFFLLLFLQVSKLQHGDATFWNMRPNVSELTDSKNTVHDVSLLTVGGTYSNRRCSWTLRIYSQS